MKSFAADHPFVIRLCIWILLPMSILVGLVANFLYSSLPVQQGTVPVTSIDSEIDIKRTSYGVPAIKASTDLDAYFALGLCHAQDRLWQLEMNKRKASGRLSEVFGEQTLESDKFFRILGLQNNAQKIWGNLSEKNKAILIHYANGINEGIRQTRVLPIEFLLNRVKPEIWSPIDSLLILQFMTWNLSSNMGDELRRMLLLQNFGIKKTNQLMPPIVLPGDRSNDKLMTSNTDFLKEYSWNEELTPKKFVGSNAWVVSGKYTESGLPILANDPHLATSIPSIWYLAHLQGATLDVTGATMPGLPFVVIGRNQNIAWGVTTMMADTQDVILEKINPVNKNQYESGGSFHEMKISKEPIKIKHDFLKPPISPYMMDVRRTANGPVVSDIGAFINGFTYSLRWTGDDEDGSTIDSFIKLNYAKNWAEFNQALSGYIAPVHYFVYADRQGNIGSLAPGKIPIRKFGRGDIPTEGWLHANNWAGWIPFSDLPREFNPVRGYILAANNRVVPNDYPYHISSDWAPDDRAKRIESELNRMVSRGGKKIRMSEMQDLQGDVYSAYKDKIFLHLSRLVPKNKRQEDVLKLFHQWDGNMDSETIGGVIMQAWVLHLNKLLLEDDVENIVGLEDLALSINLQFLGEISAGRGDDWCDYKRTAAVETCEEIEYAALDHAISDLSLRLGDDPKRWRWGKLHKIQFSHFPYSKSKYSPHWPRLNDSFLSYLFHRDVATGGDDTTVNVAPISGNKENRYAQFWGASYRQLVDLKDPASIQFEQMTGQSGNVISAHYDDSISNARFIQPSDVDTEQSKHILILSPVIAQSVKK